MSRRWLWIALVVGLCSVLSGWAIVAVWHADKQELAQAQAQWQQAPQRYQLDFTLSGDEISGAFRAEVQHQQIVSVVPITTGQPVPDTTLQTLTRVLPIEHLFDRIAETHRSSGHITSVLKRRFPLVRSVFDGLGIRGYPTCWQPTVEYVRYDELWGYPNALRWSSNRCDSGMFSLDRFDMGITAFQPLP